MLTSLMRHQLDKYRLFNEGERIRVISSSEAHGVFHEGGARVEYPCAEELDITRILDPESHNRLIPRPSILTRTSYGRPRSSKLSASLGVGIYMFIQWPAVGIY